MIPVTPAPVHSMAWLLTGYEQDFVKYITENIQST